MARISSKRVEELKKEIKRSNHQRRKEILKWLKEHPLEWEELEEKTWKNKYNPSRRDNKKKDDA